MPVGLDEDDLDALDFEADDLMSDGFDSGNRAVWGPGAPGSLLPPIDRFSGTTGGGGGAARSLREEQSAMAGMFN